MRNMRFAFLPIFILFCFLACTKSTLKRPSQDLPPRVPAAIVIEREISGPVLHQALRNPVGLAADFHGNIYVCDRGNNRVVKLRSDLTPVGDRGGYGNQPGLFDEPLYITVDNQLNLWVSDSRNRRIVRMDSDLNFVDHIPFSDPDDPLAFGVPTGIAVTSFGALWAADIERDRVVAFDNVGQFEKFVGDFGAPGGQLRDPGKVICAYDEDFYVCDPGNGRVAVYDSYGNFTDALSDPAMEEPVAVTLDAGGLLWVLDRWAGRVFCFGDEGRNMIEGGVEIIGQNFGPLDLADLAIVAENKLLISDAGGNRLLVCNVVYQ